MFKLIDFVECDSEDDESELLRARSEEIHDEVAVNITNPIFCRRAFDISYLTVFLSAVPELDVYVEPNKHYYPDPHCNTHVHTL